MERINNVCRRIMCIKIPSLIRVKAFKYPRKKELCIQVEYRVKNWGRPSPNGLWKVKNFWFHY